MGASGVVSRWRCHVPAVERYRSTPKPSRASQPASSTKTSCGAIGLDDRLNQLDQLSPSSSDRHNVIVPLSAVDGPPAADRSAITQTALSKTSPRANSPSIWLPAKGGLTACHFPPVPVESFAGEPLPVEPSKAPCHSLLSWLPAQTAFLVTVKAVIGVSEVSTDCQEAPASTEVATPVSELSQIWFSLAAKAKTGVSVQIDRQLLVSVEPGVPGEPLEHQTPSSGPPTSHRSEAGVRHHTKRRADKPEINCQDRPSSAD